jgi:hypothetical protein
VNWCKDVKKQGFYLILWSARGKDHAINALKFAELEGTIDVVIGKPSYIVDDVGWSWIRDTKVLKF